MNPTQPAAMIQCPGCNADVDPVALYCSRCGTVMRATGAEPEDPLIGKTVDGKFQVIERMAEGGTGRIYRAEQISLKKPVALKVLHPALTAASKFFDKPSGHTDRFRREAYAASRLNHPNSVQILDFGRDPSGVFYIAMEMLDGRDLRTVIDADGPLPLKRIVHIANQVLGALIEAHALGIVHRDLKPENILVTHRLDEMDFVKVVDFGIAQVLDPGDRRQKARTTTEGVILGTPEYMSPEQIKGEPVDDRTDLYSFGVVLYEMATGKVPFEGATAPHIASRHLSEPPMPPSEMRPDLPIGPAFEAIVLTALAKNPDERFEGATQMRKALLAIADLEDGESRIGLALRHAADTAPPPAPSAAEPSMSVDVSLADFAEPARRGRGSRLVLLGLLAALGAGGWLAYQSGLWRGLGLGPTSRRPVATAPIAPPALATPAGPVPAPPAVSAAAPSVAPEEPAQEGSATVPSASETGGAAATAQAATAAGSPERSHRSRRRSRSAANERVTEPPATAPATPSPAPAPAAKVAVTLAPPPATPAPAAPDPAADGRRLFLQGNCREAIPHFERALAQNERAAGVHRSLGICYSRLGDRPRMIRSFRRYIELAPNAPDAAAFRAMMGE